MKKLLLLFSLFTISLGMSQQDITVNCSAGEQNLTYCYGNNDNESFSFVSDTGAPVFLIFNSGTIESSFDEITVYDSADNSGTVLFTGDNGGDLAGLSFTSSGDALFIQVDSDGSVSCQSGSRTEWDITYRCVTCIAPEAAYDIISNCANGNEEFFIDVVITDTGDAESINISDDQGSPVQNITETGTYNFGPFANGTQVNITVADADDTNCVLESGALSQDFCPAQECDIINAGPDAVFGCADTVTSVDLSATFMTSALTTNTSVYNITDLECPVSNLEGTPTALNIDDRWSSVIDIGFDFEFFGITHSQLVVGANGLIGFNTTLAGTFCPWSFEPDELLPTPDLPTDAIFGAYHDIDPSVGGMIEYTTVGVAPERQFKVSFVDVPQFSCNELLTTQQIILYESSNVIDVIILEKPVCATWNDGLATIGVQNASGTVGYAPTGRNTGDWSVSFQELWRFIPDGAPNYVFEWFDEDGNSLGNNTDITVSPTETTTYTATVTYTDVNGQESTVSDEVTVSVIDQSPTPGPVQDLVNCENANGNAFFDLTSQDAIIFNGDPNLSVTYYETQADADNDQNAITTPTNYENTSNPQTIFFRLVNNISPSCFSTGSFNLVVTSFDVNLIAVEQGCMDDEYVMTISPINNSYDPNTVTYEWFGPPGASTLNNTSASFVGTVDGTYTVEITTSDGCVYARDIEALNTACIFPQGISPNMDGLNDTFDLRAFNVLEIEIFNRNGRSVYKKTDYTDEWFGQSDNGDLPVGTYYYVARLENDVMRTGWVYIQR